MAGLAIGDGDGEGARPMHATSTVPTVQRRSSGRDLDRRRMTMRAPAGRPVRWAL